MEQKDYLKKQIDQLGQALGKILADLLELKNQGEVNNGIAQTNQALKSELNIDIDALIAIPNNRLIDVLKKEKNLSNENINQLADILLLIASDIETKDEQKQIIYEKCLMIYEYLEKTENIHSFDRHFKIEKIKNVL